MENLITKIGYRGETNSTEVRVRASASNWLAANVAQFHETSINTGGLFSLFAPQYILYKVMEITRNFATDPVYRRF